MVSGKIDVESKVMGFQFQPERSKSSHEDSSKIEKIAEMKVILRSEIRLSGKIVILVFGKSVEIAPE